MFPGFLDSTAYSERNHISSWDHADRKSNQLMLLNDVKDYTPLLSFPNLQHLWVHQATQVQLETIGQLTQLRSLAVNRLRSITDFYPLGQLRQLQSLLLIGNTHRVSIEPLGQLTELKELVMWSVVNNVSNKGSVFYTSFSPLGNLMNLEYVSLMGVKPRDESLAAFAHLRKLKVLSLLNSFSVEEFARLSAALPATKGIFHIPVQEVKPHDFLLCKKCNKRYKVLLVGRTTRYLVCPICEANAVQSHVERFERLKRKFEAEYARQR